MSRQRRPEGSRRLIDHLPGAAEHGPLQALLATSFALEPDFVDRDFLPSLLGVPAFEDRSVRGDIQLEVALGQLDAAALLTEARQYRGRPRSLRVDVRAASSDRHGCQHAKLILAVHAEAVRLLVGSANLTTTGYRENREVAVALAATRRRPRAGALIRQALADLPARFGPWWSEAARTAWGAAIEKLDAFAAPHDSSDAWFAWGGDETPLWKRFVEQWPEGEPIQRVRIVSPFWSEEEQDGPFERLIGALRERRARVDGADALLVASPVPDGATSYLPGLPRSLSRFDFTRLGVRAWAVAARPTVDAEDVGRDDVQRARRLHAKVLLLSGPRTCLAYLGSANFTASGWGFARRSNIEAGLIVRYPGKQRAEIERWLIPPHVGERIALGPTSVSLPVTSEAEDPPQPWPHFLSSAELAPDAAGRLALLLRFARARLPSTWSLELPVDRPEPIRGFDPALLGDGSSLELALDPEDLPKVLRCRALLVKWSDCPQGVEYPLNVVRDVRDKLPLGDPERPPTEADLIAFYQGRIALEDVLGGEPQAGISGERNTASGATTGAAVDTSKILSYQVRAFVEALPGIRDELRRAAVTESSIRLALLGPISPLALARSISEAGQNGRSAMATGFQLVELLAVLRAARSTEVPPALERAWTAALSEAEREVGQLLDQVALDHGAFRRFRESILGPTRKEARR